MGIFDDLQGTGKPAGNSRPAADLKKRKPKKPHGARVSAGVDSRIPGDVVTRDGIPAAVLPETVENVRDMLPGIVGSWSDAHGVGDMRKASPLVFRAMCADIGREIVKPSGILKTEERKPAGACKASGCNAYNPAAVLLLYDIFIDFCGEWDKIPLQATFAAFSGVSLYYVKEWAHGLTGAGIQIAKKTRETELESIRAAATRDPVGRLAVLNNELWTAGGGGSIETETAGGTMPGGGAFALIDRGRVD